MSNSALVTIDEPTTYIYKLTTVLAGLDNYLALQFPDTNGNEISGSYGAISPSPIENIPSSIPEINKHITANIVNE